MLRGRDLKGPRRVQSGDIVILLGSAPNAALIRDWQRPQGCRIVAINNAWRLHEDWDFQISPDDFPQDRLPPVIGTGQRRVGSDEYVPANNRYGGIVYAGGTMAFSAGYWVLDALRPRAMVMVGCDMIYPSSGPTHFYGQGTPDPLRDDITLRSLEAKSARLMMFAAWQGCACLRAPACDSRLLCPAVDLADLPDGLPDPVAVDTAAFDAARQREADLDYVVPSGRYWTEADAFSVAEIDALDRDWLQVLKASQGDVRTP